MGVRFAHFSVGFEAFKYGGIGDRSNALRLPQRHVAEGVVQKMVPSKVQKQNPMYFVQITIL